MQNILWHLFWHRLIIKIWQSSNCLISWSTASWNAQERHIQRFAHIQYFLFPDALLGWFSKARCSVESFVGLGISFEVIWDSWISWSCSDAHEVLQCVFLDEQLLKFKSKKLLRNQWSQMSKYLFQRIGGFLFLALKYKQLKVHFCGWLRNFYGYHYRENIAFVCKYTLRLTLNIKQVSITVSFRILTLSLVSRHLPYCEFVRYERGVCFGSIKKFVRMYFQPKFAG